MRKPATALVAVFLFALSALPALAQQKPVSVGGSVAPGDVPKFQSNGMISSAGDTLGDKNAKGVNPFAVLDRGKDGICLRTDASSLPHFSFCLGHDSNGNALIDVESVGGKPARTLKCRINGVTGDCFASGGTVTPPGGSELTLNAGGCIALNDGGCIALNSP